MMPLLAMEIDNNQLLAAGAIGTLTVFGMLLKFNAQLKAYIADAARPASAGKVDVQQPLRVLQEEHVLTKAEHVEHCSHMERRVVALEARTDRIEHKMDLDKKEIIASGEERCILIHNRINDIDRKVSALDERTLTTTATLSVANAKMDRVLERLKA